MPIIKGETTDYQKFWPSLILGLVKKKNYPNLEISPKDYCLLIKALSDKSAQRSSASGRREVHSIRYYLSFAPMSSGLSATGQALHS